MKFEVVVIGAGIGGLTTAALLAARGVNVGLFERQSTVGGCVTPFEHLGYKFEPTYGLYSGWDRGGIFERVFSELPTKPPAVMELSPSYTVRLPDSIEIEVSQNIEGFYGELSRAFPECAEQSVNFYRQLKHEPVPSGEVVAAYLGGCSHRFRRFVDMQLQTFAQCASEDCPYELAKAALDPERRFWRIVGGSQALADTLAESFQASGGTFKLNSPVLRLAYDSKGQPNGIDLLSGERVQATRAIVSNLTVWDTYGKLIGLSRAPREIGKTLRHLQGWGAYLLFLALDKETSRLRSDRVIALSDWQEHEAFDPERTHFTLSVNREDEPGAVNNKLPVTVTMPVRAEDWFSFHEDHTAHESQDQSMLESLWARLHTAMPELGDSVEVIETATPHIFYETTRRKFGMVGGIVPSAHLEDSVRHPFPNVFLVGDTVARVFGIAGVVNSAHILASTLTAR